MFIPRVSSCFRGCSAVPVSPSSPFDSASAPIEPASFSFNALISLLFAADDLVTLPSLDIGVGRVILLAPFVRVTPGPAFVVLDRNLEAFVDFIVGSLEGPGPCSFALPFPFLSGSIVSDAGGGAGAGVGLSGSGGSVEGGNSSGSRFSGGCESDIVGTTGRTGSGSGAGPFEASEVDVSSGYGSDGIGGSTETDLGIS